MFENICMVLILAGGGALILGAILTKAIKHRLEKGYVETPPPTMEMPIPKEPKLSEIPIKPMGKMDDTIGTFQITSRPSDIPNPNCEACSQLEELYSNLMDTGKATNRDYWLMTELFVKLHNGRDWCG